MVSYDEKDPFAMVRGRMIREHLQGRGIKDAGVINAMGLVRREEFVPEKYQANAYDDNPLPIGCGQTISQPYIVALMTQALELNPACEVLEIGTGCGYQTAILARLARRVYSIERHHDLIEAAQTHLENLGIANVEFYAGDGTCGWPGGRTFERIIVTAAAPRIPEPLAEQLTEDGRIVIPVGGEVSQNLIAAHKHKGRLSEKVLCGCRFVKLMGAYGFEPE